MATVKRKQPSEASCECEVKLKKGGPVKKPPAKMNCGGVAKKMKKGGKVC